MSLPSPQVMAANQHLLQTPHAEMAADQHPLPSPQVEMAANPGAPYMCSAVTAFGRAAEGLLADAARAVMGRTSPVLRRHGDQEYIQLVWTERYPHLRVLPLPEEFYCPDAQVTPYYGMAGWSSQYQSTHGLMPYRCKAVHGHGYNASAFRSLLRLVGPEPPPPPPPPRAHSAKQYTHAHPHNHTHVHRHGSARTAPPRPPGRRAAATDAGLNEQSQV